WLDDQLGGVLQLPGAGVYIIEVSSLNNQQTTGDYQLYLSLAPAGCGYSVNPGQLQVDWAGGSLSVDISAATGCAWTTLSNESWITVAGNASGNGNGRVTLAV